MEFLEICDNGVAGASLVHLFQDAEIVGESFALLLELGSGFWGQLEEASSEGLQSFL